MSRHGLLRSLFAAAALLGAAGVFAASAEPLRLEVYNPGEKAIFAVSSELLVGQREAMLIDAQFSRADAEQLVKRIQASGKTLSTIYISHGDPDFYFGLDVLKAAFPEAKILATAQTVAHIQATKDAKLAYWGPILKDNAPTSLVVPEPLKGDQLKLEGHALKVVDLKGPSEAELPKARDSAALVEAMKRRYPNLPGEEGLELSAKVLKGEMQWP